METCNNVDNLKIDNKGGNTNAIEAIMNGAGVGLQVVLGICVALIAVIGMVALVNMILGFAGLSLEMIFGYVFCPFGYLMGL